MECQINAAFSLPKSMSVSLLCPFRIFFFLINTQGTGYVKITIHVNIPATKRWQTMALTSQEVQSVSMRNSTTGTAKDDS